jgi:sulfite oxidase
MRTYDEQGLNVGSRLHVVDASVITSTDAFFRRNHAPFPIVDPVAWRLELGGLVAHPMSFSLEELTTQFPRCEVAATLVCAGLRRAEFVELGPLPGELPWGPDAASTGRWRGVRLADVLRAAGPSGSASHVHLDGLDRVSREGRAFGFGGSIEMAKAMSDEVVLATHLNGAPLPIAHGFPLRAVIPGWIGARSVKWLGRITLASEPSSNYFQAKAYRIQRDVNPADPRDVTAGSAMTHVPLNAVIVDPAPDAVVPAGRVRVRGWAIGSACRPLSSIEVSMDGGSEWLQAIVVAPAERWTWTFWEAVLRLAPGPHVLIARATDQIGRMPAHVSDTWNVKGYGNNAWHRVAIRVE